MNRCYLIVAAVLGAGCEHFKSPERIHELEGRVNELSAEVSALAGKPVGGKAKPPNKAGEHSGSGEAPHGEGAQGGEKGDKGEKGEKGDKGDGDKGDGDKDAKGEGGSEAHAADGEAPGSKEDPAVARLKALVAKNTPKPDEHKVAHWSYEGKDGPPRWGALDPAWSACQKGIAQSPVDIEPRAGNASPIVFRYKPTAAAVIDNGHTLQVNLAPGSWIDIDGKPYELVQFHFHSPSEHTVAGEHYPLELHLVHKSAAGKLAVVGVMYDAGADSKSLAMVWSKWPKKVGVEDKLRKAFDPSTLLPETRTVFRYPGSLTTPPCTEGVVWNVMRRTMSDGKKNLDAFGRHYPNNAREVQALNDRKIE